TAGGAMSRVVLAVVMLLAGCARDEELPALPPDKCPDDYVGGCQAVLATCLKSSVCQKGWTDFELPITCLPTCERELRRCCARCPVTKIPLPPWVIQGYPDTPLDTFKKGTDS